MERQPPLGAPEEGMSVLMQAGYLPSTEEYSTVIRHYPGNNAHPPWGTAGRFRFGITIFENGEPVSSGATAECDEKGFLYMDVGEVAERCGHAVKGMFIVEYHHAKDIPVELYAFHIHKPSGTYVACNISAFIGDRLYPSSHSDQMENTLFWPGMVADTDNEPYVVVVNPYDARMGFQVHLIGAKGSRTSTGMLHLKPKLAGEYRVAELFEGVEEEIRGSNGRLSICVSSQYKLVAYVMFKTRVSQVMSMMDHLHTFCLA